MSCTETVPVPELLTSVYGQMEKLMASFKMDDLQRKKREAKQEMDCQSFLDLLSLYQELKPLIETPEKIRENQEKIQELSNDIQMYSTFEGVSQETCNQVDQSILKEKVQSTKDSLGICNIQIKLAVIID